MADPQQKLGLGSRVELERLIGIAGKNSDDRPLRQRLTLDYDPSGDDSSRRDAQTEASAPATTRGRRALPSLNASF